MPLYEYQCDGCGRRFELIRKFSDPPLDVCPSCGAAVRKLFSSPAIQFKGSGFYITDYPKKDQPGAAGKTDKTEQAERSESTKTDSPKTEAAKGDTAKSDSGATSDKADRDKKDTKADKKASADSPSTSTTPTKS